EELEHGLPSLGVAAGRERTETGDLHIVGHVFEEGQGARGNARILERLRLVQQDQLLLWIPGVRRGELAEVLDHHRDIPFRREDLPEEPHRPGARVVSPAQEATDRLDGGLAPGADEPEDVLLLVGVGGGRLDGDGEASEERGGGLGELHLPELLDGLLPRLRAAVLLRHLGLELGSALGALAAAEDVENAHGTRNLLEASDRRRAAPPPGGGPGSGARRGRWLARFPARASPPPLGW